MKIPQYEPVSGYYEKRALTSYLENPGFWTEYKKTEEFEEKISSYLDTKHCIVVNNGTISLSLALLAMGIKSGDNIIVPNITMIATPNAVRLIGANPIFCDITPNGLLSFAIADQLVQVYKAKAIIYVSLNGRSFRSTDWKYIYRWRKSGVRLLEDSAQAFGSKNYEGKFCGTRGFEIGSFSFSMPKIITTGQGGCLVTNDDVLADSLRRLKDFGRCGGGNDTHSTFGINCKFTEMQAILGIEQLGDIEYRVRRKKQMLDIYKEELNDIKEITFIEETSPNEIPWFIEIHTDNPSSLGEYLKEQGIGTRRVYPPIHTQQAYSSINDWSYPVSSDYSATGIWLPSSFKLLDDNIRYICRTIKEYYVSTR